MWTLKVLVLVMQYYKSNWYWYCNTFKKNCIGIGIGNTFFQAVLILVLPIGLLFESIVNNPGAELLYMSSCLIQDTPWSANDGRMWQRNSSLCEKKYKNTHHLSAYVFVSLNAGNLHRVSKKRANLSLASCNSNKHGLILTIFGKTASAHFQMIGQCVFNFPCSFILLTLFAVK